MPALTDAKRETFCQHYALTLDVGKSEEAAGYTPKYGYELRKNPEVADRIAEIQREAGVRMVVNQARVVREAAYLAHSDITDVLACRTVADLQALPENVRRAIKRVKITMTPVSATGKPDRRSQRATDGLGPMSQSDQNCQLVTKEPEYEHTIEIEMHPKTEMLKLLALVTQAVSDPETLKKNAPSFTGMSITVAEKGAKSGKKVSKEQKKESEND